MEWVPCVVPVGEDGKVTVIEQNPSMGYLVVRKGFEHPEVAVKLVSLAYDYMRRSDYVQSDAEKAYIAGDVGCDFLGNCDFNNALVLSYEDIRDILDGKSPAWLLPAKNTWTQSMRDSFRTKPTGPTTMAE